MTSLARTLQTPNETVAAQVQSLRKENKALKEKLRRRNGFKAPTGCKCKAPKKSDSASQRK